MARNTRVFLCSSELSPTCFDFKVLLILQHPMTPLKRSKAILYSDRLRSLVDQPRLFSLVQFSSFNSNFLNPPQQSDAMCEMCFFVAFPDYLTSLVKFSQNLKPSQGPPLLWHAWHLSQRPGCLARPKPLSTRLWQDWYHKDCQVAQVSIHLLTSMIPGVTSSIKSDCQWI